jgi:hypothetical protein
MHERGEAEIDGGSGGGVDAAEGQITCCPQLDPRAVGRKHGPPNMVGAHKVQLAVLEHAHNRAIHPDIFADQARLLQQIRTVLTIGIGDGD